MGIRIRTNIQAIKSQRSLTQSQTAQENSMERLASGQRINRSSDDAAGLAVSERLRAKLRSLDVAKRNANDGISYIQVAEGGLNEVSNIVVRMRELSSQAASDTIGNLERSFLDKEFQQLRKEVGRIVETTEFNGSKLLNPEELKPISIFVGATNRGEGPDGSRPEFSEGEDPDVLTIDLNDLSAMREKLDKIVNEDLSIMPEDSSGGASDLGPTGTNELFGRLDDSLNSIAGFRSTLGAVQSRLNSTITNIEISNENLSAARSRIADVDYASETASFAQAKILTQAGIAVQAQANAAPEAALQLLRS
jgi:flagellin